MTDTLNKQVKLPPSFGENIEVAFYLHWPFCERKCPYCDFNSHVQATIDHIAWQKAYFKEIGTLARHYPNITISSIFFGGGTPSLMPAELVGSLLNEIGRHWKTVPNIEITLEANPSSSEAARFQAYKAAGVNRLSVGLQSLKDRNLKFLGRLHSAEEALSTVTLARQVFERVSFDMIYALPEQTIDDWGQELDQALTFSPDHLSLYQLTIEEGTAFHSQYKRGRLKMPDEALSLALFDMTNEKTSTFGLPAYEVSNYARPGYEARHNLAYWTGKPYFGVGPGAHGRLPGWAGAAYATSTYKNPQRWLKMVSQQNHGFSDIDAVSNKERAVETIMMGLRLIDGLNLPSLNESLSLDLLEIFDPSGLQMACDNGFVKFDNDRIWLTTKGRPLLNALLPHLIGE